MAPEMIKNELHDHRIDIWSLGVLLYELLHGHAPHNGKSESEKIQQITNPDYEIKYSEKISSEAKDLISSILKINKNERPTFDQIFEHAWMKKYEKAFKMNIENFRFKPKEVGQQSAEKKIVPEVKVKNEEPQKEISGNASAENSLKKLDNQKPGFSELFKNENKTQLDTGGSNL